MIAEAGPDGAGGYAAVTSAHLGVRLRASMLPRYGRIVTLVKIW
jgi:hypothetical protein